LWQPGPVKTTIDLPDELMRTIKIRAIQENRKLKDMVADLLRRGLAAESGPPRVARERIQLPLVRCAHPADPSKGMTAERVAQILLEGEARGAGA
jgi:hypothetical protein